MPLVDFSGRYGFLVEGQGGGGDTEAGGGGGEGGGRGGDGGDGGGNAGGRTLTVALCRNLSAAGLMAEGGSTGPSSSGVGVVSSSGQALDGEAYAVGTTKVQRL